MAAAVQLLEGNELVIAEDGLSATVIFQGTESTGVPNPGESYPGFVQTGPVTFRMRSRTQRTVGKTQDGDPVYQWTCVYNTKVRDTDEGDDDEAPRRIEFGVTGQTLPESKLYWAADDPIDVPVPVFTPTMELVYTRIKSSFPASDVADKIGIVNEGTFEGFAAQTVMFTGGSANEFTNKDGSKRWRIELRFSYNPNGWNKILKPGSSDYANVYRTSGTTDPLYATGSLGTLL